MRPAPFTFVESLWLPGNLPCSLRNGAARGGNSGGGDEPQMRMGRVRLECRDPVQIALRKVEMHSAHPRIERSSSR